MPTISIDLPEDLRRFVDQRVRSGAFADAKAVIVDALYQQEQLLLEDEAKVAAQMELAREVMRENRCILQRLAE